ncbi:MAG: hypothetical protein WC246_01820 [Candidatus Paceibacterota bacterium]
MDIHMTKHQHGDNWMSSTAWLVLGIGAALIIAGGIATQWWFTAIQAQAQRAIAQQQVQLAQVMEQIYQMRNGQDLGGKTPEETLYQYTESVEIGFYKVPSTYFVRDMRAQEAHRFDGVSRDKVWQFVMLMKDETAAAAGLKLTGDVVAIPSPLKVKLQKAANGVWQISSIDYSFASTTSN